MTMTQSPAASESTLALPETSFIRQTLDATDLGQKLTGKVSGDLLDGVKTYLERLSNATTTVLVEQAMRELAHFLAKNIGQRQKMDVTTLSVELRIELTYPLLQFHHAQGYAAMQSLYREIVEKVAQFVTQATA